MKIIFIVSALAVITVILTVFLRKNSPEYSLLLSLAFICAVLFTVFTMIKGIFDDVTGLITVSEIALPSLKTVFKALGIGYVASFSADVCRDNGQTAIASSVELTAKALIVLLSLPLITEIIEICTELNK